MADKERLKAILPGLLEQDLKPLARGMLPLHEPHLKMLARQGLSRIEELNCLIEIDRLQSIPPIRTYPNRSRSTSSSVGWPITWSS
jgi:hypothetical protein